MNLAIVRLTPAVKCLLIVHCLIFALQLIGSNVIANGLALVCRWGAVWQIWRFFTYAFLHYSVIGFLLSALALLFIGSPLEGRLGLGKFLIIYFGSVFTGAVAAFCTGSILSESISPIIVYGSSAGILGALAYLIRLEPEAIFNIWLIVLLPIKAVFLWWFTAIGLVVMLVGHWGSNGSIQADLGGFVFGTVSIMFLERLRMLKFEEKVQKRWRAWKRWRKLRKFSCLEGLDNNLDLNNLQEKTSQRAELKLLPRQGEEDKSKTGRSNGEMKLDALMRKLTSEGAKCLTEEERNFLAARSTKKTAK